MNCANHPDRERVAFCQNCGKPLCTECVRNVGASIFCEPCLTARVAGAPPQAGYGVPGPGYAPGPAGYPPPGMPPAPSGPNPVLAGALGLIPGVGAMYNEQYAKGIVHLIVFALLVSLASDVNDIFGLFVFGWICYMAIEAYQTARARRDGTPLPNPFGLNDISERLGFGKAWPGSGPVVDPLAGPGAQTPPAAGAANPYTPLYSSPYAPPVASWGAPPSAGTYNAPPIPPMPPVPPVPGYPDPNAPFQRRFPTGAIWLIGLGLFFLVANTPFFHVLHGALVMPFLLIGFGVWLFVHKMTSGGQGLENDGTPLYHWRLHLAIRSSFWIVLTGVIWLLHALHILSWGRSWPIYIIAAGLMMFFKRTMDPMNGYGYPPPVPTPPPAAPVTSTAIVPSDPNSQPGSNDQEGR